MKSMKSSGGRWKAWVDWSGSTLPSDLSSAGVPIRNTQVVLLLIQTGDNRSPRRDTSYSDELVSRVAPPPVLFWPRI